MNTAPKLATYLPPAAPEAAAQPQPVAARGQYVRGIVKSWLDGVKFGFVAPDSDYDFDVFVPGHVVPKRNGVAKLYIGEAVEFNFALKQYRVTCTKLRFPGSEAAAPESQSSHPKS